MTNRPNTPPHTPVRRTPWPEAAGRALATPMQPSVVYTSGSPDELDAHYEGSEQTYAYAREGHPNADVLAAKLDAMEGGQGGIVVGSGMAAITAVVLGLCQAGDHVLGGNQLYGKSLKMLGTDLPRLGIATSTADFTDVAAVEAAIRPETKLILLEVVSNPTIRVADVTGIAALAKKHGILLAVDNTFTTPRSFRPFDHGADVVIHSVTKILAGHSDATLGYACALLPEHNAALAMASSTWGLTASPFDCWIAERGLYSFDLRYDQAERNAAALADHLVGLKGVKRVLYPTRADHPDAPRGAELLGARGSHMVSFEIEGGRAEANRLVRAVPELPFAPTLGDVATTISHPCTSSHRLLSAEALAELGINEGFFRISVGIEETDMILGSFTRALEAI
ncbi:aminotransferase class I/II-fold pyridoxal phosphate-dependent enzyme [Alphaproteobacteria bacterium KMM 3653]|uniref:Aminotransferase class I/II-fold pyridoxal phosphate-dependent enzyme n=1 Tax=Harenicola maris TaxID=2841044 RepID=A0AAP2CSJ1_9RHOB|nr:aminotransferase class I/II-fold pyridoxal phosphate-dependent enzyme [Harenicola maris]